MIDRGFSNKRHNVIGPGPNRNLLPLAKYLGPVPQDIVDVCMEQITENDLGNQNHCGSEFYPISITSPLMQLFSQEYKQTLLQSPATDGLTERDYTLNSNPIMESISKTWPELHTFRARIAKLPHGEVIDWHIDTNTSVYCRIQLAITGGCTWQLKKNKEITTIDVPKGGIWFFNTGYSHRVENTTSGDRWVVILNCDYADIERTFGDLRS